MLFVWIGQLTSSAWSSKYLFDWPSLWLFQIPPGICDSRAENPSEKTILHLPASRSSMTTARLFAILRPKCTPSTLPFSGCFSIIHYPPIVSTDLPTSNSCVRIHGTSRVRMHQVCSHLNKMCLRFWKKIWRRCQNDKQASNVCLVTCPVVCQMNFECRSMPNSLC